MGDHIKKGVDNRTSYGNLVKFHHLGGIVNAHNGTEPIPEKINKNWIVIMFSATPSHLLNTNLTILQHMYKPLTKFDFSSEGSLGKVK